MIQYVWPEQGHPLFSKKTWTNLADWPVPLFQLIPFFTGQKLSYNESYQSLLLKYSNMLHKILHFGFHEGHLVFFKLPTNPAPSPSSIICHHPSHRCRKPSASPSSMSAGVYLSSSWSASGMRSSISWALDVSKVMGYRAGWFTSENHNGELGYPDLKNPPFSHVEKSEPRTTGKFNKNWLNLGLNLVGWPWYTNRHNRL